METTERNIRLTPKKRRVVEFAAQAGGIIQEGEKAAWGWGFRTQGDSHEVYGILTTKNGAATVWNSWDNNEDSNSLADFLGLKVETTYDGPSQGTNVWAKESAGEPIPDIWVPNSVVATDRGRRLAITIRAAYLACPALGYLMESISKDPEE